MTTRHIDTRVKEHLHSKTKSAIHDHIKDCKTCLETEYDSRAYLGGGGIVPWPPPPF